MSMKRFAAAVIALVLASSSQAANTWNTDLSDLYLVPSEQGWGVNFIHQGTTIFATLFIFGPDGKGKWYVASELEYRSTNAQGALIFFGALYEMTGPYFAGPFLPGNLHFRAVGHMTATMLVDRGTLTYSIDGFDLTKDIERYSFRGSDMTGSYIGGEIGTASGCGVLSGRFENPVNIFITHFGGSFISIGVVYADGNGCSHASRYSQVGRMGSMAGTFQCSDGSRGTFQGFETEAGSQGFLMRYTADYGGGCVATGRLGGVKR